MAVWGGAAASVADERGRDGMTVVKRHPPLEDCNGEATKYVCPECTNRLCFCEYAFGHDCEVP